MYDIYLLIFWVVMAFVAAYWTAQVVRKEMDVSVELFMFMIACNTFFWFVSIFVLSITHFADRKGILFSRKP